ASYFDPRGAVDAYYPLPAVPYLKFSAVHDQEAGTLTLFALNRHLEEPMTVEVITKGFPDLKIVTAHQLPDEDLAARNSKDQPDRIRPALLKDIEPHGTHLRATLAPASWNVIRLA